MSSEYTVKQIADATKQPKHAIRFVLKQIKPTIHEEIHPTLQFYKFEDLPEKYRMALQPTHTDKSGHTSFGCGTIPAFSTETSKSQKQTPPEIIDEKFDRPETVPVFPDNSGEVHDVDIPPAEDNSTIYEDSAPPVGALPELTPELIYAFKDVFGADDTKNILRNNYQINPS